MPAAIESSSFFRRYGWVLLLILLGTPVTLLLAGLVFFLFHQDALLDFDRKISEISNNTLLFDLHGKRFQSLRGLESRIVIPRSSISRDLQMSVLAAEDSRFFQHRGIDAFRLIKSVWNNLISGSFQEGASTITQQLVRLTLLSQEKTLIRKFREMAISLWLEFHLGKEQIFEYYLNSIYLGHGNYGVERASRSFFRVSAVSLNLAQSAFIAALIKKPEYYLRHSGRNSGEGIYFSRDELKDLFSRQRLILNRLLTLGWIGTNEHLKALDQDLWVSYAGTSGGAGSYFAQHVISLLKKKHGINQVYGRGWRVWTTFRPELQQRLETMIEEEFLTSAPLERQIAVVAMDPNTGEVWSLSGGKDYQSSSYNRATQAQRQPGSAIKPLLYATALERSFRPNSVFADKMLLYEWEDRDGTTENYAPMNADGLYGKERLLRSRLGENYRSDRMTLGKAFELSINTIAVQLLESLGIEAFTGKTKKLRLSLRKEAGLCLALGCSETDLLSLTASYTPFFNQGRFRVPVFIKRIESASGRLIYQFQAEDGPQIFPAKTMYQIQDFLIRTVRDGTGQRASWKEDNLTLFGKTGTSSNARDAWFVGAVPEMLTGIWIGHDDNKPMPGEQGGKTPAAIWRAFSREALNILPDRKMLPLPEALRAATCRVSGKLAVDKCPDVARYPYFDGEVPDELCDVHKGMFQVQLRSSLDGPGNLR